MDLRQRAARTGRLLRGLASLRRDDVVLASFPRSGSTWLRFVLANWLVLTEADGEPLDLERLDPMMPELAVDDLSAPWPFTGLPRIVKTHRRHNPAFRRARCVLLIRDPRDAVASYFRFVKASPSLDFAGDFAAFARSHRFGLPAWFAHWASWRDRCALLLRYEDLRRDTASEVAKLLALAGARPDASALEEAVRRSSLAEMQRLEARSAAFGEGWSPGFRFVGEGESGGGAEKLTPELELLYAALRQRHGMTAYA